MINVPLRAQALVGCQTVEGTSELLTADTSGVFKLWDLRNFQCIQTFTSEHEPGDVDDLTDCLNCFVHVKLPPPAASGADALLGAEDPPKDEFRIIAASKKLLFFDQEREKKERASDEAPIVAACFNEESLTILSACERSVKVWDALLGSVKRHFRNIAAHDISAICLDDRKRKFVLGDAAGDIVVYNYMNGAAMKRCTATPHSPVAQLIYCDRCKSLLAAFNDGTIRVYDEADIETCKVPRNARPYLLLLFHSDHAPPFAKPQPPLASLQHPFPPTLTIMPCFLLLLLLLLLPLLLPLHLAMHDFALQVCIRAQPPPAPHPLGPQCSFLLTVLPWHVVSEDRKSVV